MDWRASWCGPCRMFAPVFQAASRQHPDITFGKIDTGDQPELSAVAEPEHCVSAAIIGPAPDPLRACYNTP